MSRRLHHRVRNVGGNHQRAMAAYTPVPSPGAAQVSGSAASPPAVDVMPLAQVTVYPAPGGEYATIAYQGLAPIYTSGPNRRPIPATSPGRWGQLVSAGRP